MTTKPSYTPTLRFPDFLNDGEWEVKRLGEIITVNSGRDYKHLQSGDIPVYGTGGYMLSVNDKLSDIDAIGIGRKGTIDKPQYLKAPFWTVDTLFFLTTKEGYDLIFVFCLLQTVEWKKYSEQTGVPSLTRSTIEKIEVKIPPFSEQRRIAQALTALDELIAATNGKLEQMKAYKKGLMQKLFPARGKKLPELRFKEFEKDGEWEEKRLGDVVEIYDGIHQTPNYTKKGVMFVSVEDISTLKSNKFISEEDFFRDFKVYPQRGDILMTRIGNIGIANVYDKDELLAYYVSLALFKPKSINSYFLKQSIDSYYFQYQLSIKTLHIAFPKKINKTELESILVYCPSIPEQRKIADCLTLIDEMINQYTNKVAILELYKKGLMQQMFPNSK